MIREGTKVEWDWGNGTATGVVTKVHRSKITRAFDGQDITRNATDDTPAYDIEQDDGQCVLKSSTEVRRVD